MKKVILILLITPFLLQSCGGDDGNDGESKEEQNSEAQKLADQTCACFEKTDKGDNAALSECWKDWMSFTKQDDYDYNKYKKQIRQVNDCSQ